MSGMFKPDHISQSLKGLGNPHHKVLLTQFLILKVCFSNKSPDGDDTTIVVTML